VTSAGVLVRPRSKIKTLIHEGDQSLPTIKVEIASQRSQVVEEGASDSEFAAYSLIHATAEVQDAMKEKSEDQEGQQDHGKVLFAMAVVVLEVIAVVLEHVKAFVFYLPTATAAGNDVYHEVLVE